jgi:peptidoglycan/LPS O-acetylase OafA/YrhL
MSRRAPANTDTSPRLGHRPALDGVRAIAIAAVMGLHIQDRLVPGGFWGVDVFFVLSAFLITSLILEELDERQGRYGFRAFYLRRALRLGPALLLWLAAVAAPTAVVLHEAAKIPIATLVSLFYVGDFTIAAGGDIGTSYTHIWSLAIEEQFYSVWPWIVVTYFFAWPARKQRAVLSAVLVASIPLTYVSGEVLGGSYFLPTGHLVPLAAGALASVLFMRGAGPVESLLRSSLVALPCLCAIAVAVLAFRPTTAIAALAVQPAVALATAVLLLHLCARPEGIAARLMSSAPLVWLGRRSYGLYLYHRTLAVLGSAALSGVANRFLAPAVLVVSLAIAEISFRFVERPVNRMGRSWLRRRTAGRTRAAEFALPIPRASLK